MILDPEKIVSDYTDEEQAEIVEQVRLDFLAAEENRDEREEIAMQDYELYMRKRRDAQAQAAERGGSSKIEVPIVYWNIEHQVPRLGVDPPTITVKALNGESVPYQMAKQLRLQWYLNRCGWDIPYQMVVRSKLILGDGIAMVPWSAKMHMPRIMHVDWFDFFVSAEATVFEAAEAHFHRTFWTRRGMEQLAGELDESDRPIWHNLDDVPTGSLRSQIDDTWDRRRGLADQGSGSNTQAGANGGETPMISCWYSTGEYIVLGGPDHNTLVRAQMSPYWRRCYHPGTESYLEYLRPFTFFRNIPDLTGPYSLSEPRALEDHQLEMSTLRNQAIDQVSLDINAPIVHDSSIPDELVAAAFASPKGRLAVPWGPSGPLIMRMPVGQPSSGLPMIYDQVRNEAQLISGMNDNAAGQPVNGEQTATEIQVLSAEANKRIQLKRKMDEIAMKQVAMAFDFRDRQLGGILMMEPPSGTRMDGLRGFRPLVPDQMDVSQMMAGHGPGVRPGVATGFVQLSVDVNGPGLDYEVLIDAGSAIRADQAEETQRLMSFVAAISHPEIALRVDWDEVTRSLITAFGFSAERLFHPAPPPLPAPVGPDGTPTAPGAPAAPPA